MIAISARNTGAIRVQPKIEFDRIMVRIGEDGAIFLDVADARDLIKQLRAVIGDG